MPRLTMLACMLISCFAATAIAQTHLAIPKASGGGWKLDAGTSESGLKLGWKDQSPFRSLTSPTAHLVQS